MKKRKNNATGWRNDKNSIYAFLGDNKRLLMPVILALAVIITVAIALGANHRANELAQADPATEGASSIEITEVAMEQDAYPDVNALISKYYDASANGDADTIKSIYRGLDDTEALKAVAASEYIDSFENITVFTKPGPVAGSYIAYVYNEVKLYNYDKPVPGLETMYVCTAEDGSLYINGDIADANEIEYIRQINVQSDVIDLNNKVATQYNEMVSADEKLAELLNNMKSGLQISVGEALASAEAASIDDSAAASSTEEEQPEEPEKVTIHTIRATDVINIRSSDSETADIIDKTERGQEFKQLEALANGWSKIEYKGGVAYVKTEFFEVVGEETVEVDTTDTDSKDSTSTATDDKKTETDKTDTTATKVSTAKTGEMTVNDGVRLRKERNTSSEIITMIYAGQKVNVVEQYSDGWAKVEYKNKTGYIKSEFLE